VEPLIASLSELDSTLQGEIALALGKIGDQRAVKPLINLLKGLSGDAKRDVVGALIDLGWEPAGQKNQIIFLALANKWDELQKMGAPAVELIAEKLLTGNSNASKAAANALGHLGWKPTTKHEEIAFLLAKGGIDELAQTGSAVLEPLIHAFKEKGFPHREKIPAVLGKIKDLRALEPLIESLQDADNLVREASIMALEEIGDSRAIEPLIKALEDTDESVRNAASKGLGNIGDSQCFEHLHAIVKDKKKDIILRRGAAEAIKHKTGKRPKVKEAFFKKIWK
jgi:HEAT repeat protein